MTSSRARSRRLIGSSPPGCSEQPLHLRRSSGPREACAPRCGGVRVAAGSSSIELLAAQVAVEGAQAGGLAVDGRRRAGGRRPLPSPVARSARKSARSRASASVASRSRSARKRRTGAGRCDTRRACCARARARTRGARGSRAPAPRSAHHAVATSPALERRSPCRQFSRPGGGALPVQPRRRARSGAGPAAASARSATWRPGTRRSRRRGRRERPRRRARSAPSGSVGLGGRVVELGGEEER